MKMPKINLGFSRFSDANFLAKSNHIYLKLNGNAYFPDPNPTLAAVLAAINDYSARLNEAQELGKDNVAEKNKSRQVLEGLLKTLGLWVMFTANGNLTMLISSGYDITKEPEPGKLGDMGPLMLSNGNVPGTLKVKADRPAAAQSFIHQITDTLPTESTVWKSTTTGTCRFTHSSLQPGKQYWVRVIATATKGQESYSPIATQFAQ